MKACMYQLRILQAVTPPGCVSFHSLRTPLSLLQSWPRSGLRDVQAARDTSPHRWPRLHETAQYVRWSRHVRLRQHRRLLGC